MFSSLLSLWSFIPKRYLTNNQVLFFTFRHLWKTENKWKELKNGNNYRCNTSSELPLQFIQQVETCEVTSKKLVGLLQRPLVKKKKKSKPLILCSLLRYWPHPGRVGLLVHLQPAAACHSSSQHTGLIPHGHLWASPRSLRDTGPVALGRSESIPVLKSLRFSFLIKALWRASKC